MRTINLTSVKKDGTTLLCSSHRKVSPKDCLETVLTDYKLIVDAEDQADNKGNSNDGNGSGNQSPKYSLLKELTKKSMSD